MYNATQITDGLYFVGAKDPSLRVFDVIMESPRGTSYNSYVLKGHNGVAVIEACKEGFEQEWIGRIRDCVDPAEITHVFLNHTEPDHAGALAALLSIAPNAKVYASRPAIGNIDQIVNAPFPGEIVKGGDVFDLGGVSLLVIDAPFLHWPDSLFLWCEQKGALFTCDVFGYHDCMEHLFYHEYEKPDMEQRRYYFDVIFAPFAGYVKAALNKIRSLPIAYLLTSHGPVYGTESSVRQTIELYDAWADETLSSVRSNAVFIGYASAYGYTQMAAEAIAEGVSQAGLEPVLCDIGQDEHVAATASRCAAIAIGSSTLNRDALPPVWALLSHLSAISMRGRPAMAFGSYGWSGEAVGNLSARLAQLGMNVREGLRFKLRPTGEDLEAAKQAGVELAVSVRGDEA